MMVPAQREAEAGTEQNWVRIHPLLGAQPGKCISGHVPGDVGSYLVSWGLSLFLSLSLSISSTHLPLNQV